MTDLGVGQSGHYLPLTRLWTGVQQVSAQCVVKEVGILGDDPHDVANRLHCGVTDIDAVQLQ